MNTDQITPHMEVVGSDGQHVGTVDNLGIKLTKNDPAAEGQHHYLKLDTVKGVENGKLVLTVSASEAKSGEKVVAS